jgi:hypothetical protein
MSMEPARNAVLWCTIINHALPPMSVVLLTNLQGHSLLRPKALGAG